MTVTPLVRLHVSPLTPETYPIVVPSSLHAAVSDLSYHRIPAFPERNYGFVELPAADAEKLKKRLSGAIVKGAKIKVEPARTKPDWAERSRSSVAEGKEEKPVRSSESSIRDTERGRADGRVVFGVQLPESRKVRRGWTQPIVMKRDRKAAAAKAEETSKSKSKAKKSEYTEKEECLFQTKTKEPKEGAKKRKRGDDTTVVHEFKNTTKFPTFLRGQTGNASKPTTEYDPEKGWIDTEGNVVEQPRRSKRLSQEIARETVLTERHKVKSKTSSVTRAAKKLSLKGAQPEETAEDATSSSGDSDSDEEEDEGGKAETAKSKRLSMYSVQSLQTAETSSEGSDSSEAEEDTANDANERVRIKQEASAEKDSQPVPLADSAAEKEEGKDEVHPLEAIFKKPKINSRKPPGLELKIPFSFFGSDADQGGSENDEGPSELPPMPQTPFTQADLRFRRERSAAPTPDTAAPTKLLFGPVLDRAPPGGQDESSGPSGDESGGSTGADEQPSTGAGAGSKPGRSEFADKWFWENRGENNRAWKKRRREASKQKRQADNKRSSRRDA